MNLRLEDSQVDLILAQAESRLMQGEMIYYGYRQTLTSIYKQLPIDSAEEFTNKYPLLNKLLNISSHKKESIIDNEMYLKQEIASLEEELKKIKNLMKLQEEMYEAAFKFIDKAIYAKRCTMQHQDNTELERGQVRGLLSASNTVDYAFNCVTQGKIDDLKRGEQLQ